jgi:CheY-like chemotaxis protein
MMPPKNKIPRDVFENWSVLVVDDEVDSLEVAARILRYYNADVYTATNGQTALSIIQTIKPCFVISDLSMPHLDGWGMLEAMKCDPELAQIPVIALTAHAWRGDRERALEAGFQNYLTKPLTPALFIKELLLVLIRYTRSSFDQTLIEYIQE